MQPAVFTWIDLIKIAIPVIVPFLCALYVYRLNKGAARHEQFVDVENRVTAAETRLQAVEQKTADACDLETRLRLIEREVGDAPSRDSIHELAITIEKLNGTMLVHAERFGKLERLIDRQEKATVRLENAMQTIGKTN